MSDLHEGLSRLGLRVPKEALDALLIHAQKSKLSPTELLEGLAAIEQREREARNLARRAKHAKLGSPKGLDRFDWNHPRAIDRELYEHLYSTLEFLRRGENVLFRGPAGVGKTTLSQNLGLRALACGHTVLFSTLPAALADLMRQESLPAVERRLRRYTSLDLLILDELGYVPCDARAADLFFHIVSRRHEHKPIVLTTNLAYKQWTSVFKDASCLDALVDRFAQHCHTLDIDADSWRQKSSLRRSPSRSPLPRTDNG
ncbi:IS21-like element helper ATPase IstB [Sorangium sp. So ce1014]|uniref:IS21-like element helper ATPase IstB n=1 Tax=Sorangium sp. So ce1014 TaxID=3133326 RepID=UPI003F5D6F02